MVELLSPGGSLEKIYHAFNFGADAVYCGYQSFNLRSKSNNLNESEIIKASNIAHKKNKRIYITLNAYLFDKDFKKLIEFITFLNTSGIDGIIVSDLGVLSIINDYSNIPIHISTQANITNSYAANFLKKFNVKRIIPSRELNLEQITQFRSNTHLELEVFIHGAMCMAYSGRCFLSSFLANRSANSGDCAQSCRWEYYVVEKTRKNEFFTVEEYKEGSFLFNSYDLCTMPILDKIIKSGVNALKIEGRMKSTYYVSLVSAIYKDAINTIENGGNFQSKIPFYMKELKKISHRKYSTGFFENNQKQNINSAGYERNCNFLGVIQGKSERGILIRVRNQMRTDIYEIFKKDLTTVKIKIDKFYSLDNTEKEIVNPNEFVYIKSNVNVSKLDIVRKCYK